MAVTVMDRIFIEIVAGPQIAGYYTFIFIFISLLSVVPNAITELLLAKFFNINRSNSSSIKLLKKSSFTLFFTTIASILMVFFVMDFFIISFFPKYIEIIEEIKVALLYVIPASLISVFQYYIISYMKDRSIIKINVITLIFFYLTFALIVHYSTNLNLYSFIIIRLMHIWLFFVMTFYVLVKTVLKYKNET